VSVILQRLVITFKTDEIVLHALYRTQDGTNPGMKARCKEVTEITRSGLTQALEALECGVQVLRTSRCEMREDIINTDAGKGD
jgi:hypothetical protein